MECNQEDIKALVNAVQRVCKAFALFKNSGLKHAEDMLADRIIEAERLTRAL